MASSNVKYYEKQRELQNTITDCQQQRMDQERQFQMALKSDQTSSQIKASKLHTYWRKICEDERRAKQRNEMLMRDLERIDSHMAELNARTQRLALVKKQYEDYISRTYPKWNELVNSCQQPTELSTEQPSRSSPLHSHYPQPQQEMGRVGSRSHSVPEAGGDVKNMMSDRSEVFKNEYDDPKRNSKHQQQLEQKHWNNQRSIHEKETPVHTQQIDKQKMDANLAVYANLPTSQADNQILHKSGISDNVHIRSYETPSKSVKNMEIQSYNAEKITSLTNVVHSGGDEDEEEMSDFGSDSDLPMAQSLGNTKLQAEAQPTVEKMSSLSKTVGSTNPELSVDGLMHLLQLVESEIMEAFSCEDYYRRTTLPDAADKNDIIRKANNYGDLSKVDTSLITMVILEQITHIIQNLTEKCLLPEELLKDTSIQSAAMLRQHLSPEAQVIWDALYAHFVKLIQCHVFKPSELARIFTPCLVSCRETLDKGHQFLVHLLEGMASIHEHSAVNAHSPACEHSAVHEHSVVKSSNDFASPRQTLENSASFTDDAKVPPLKFGSLLEKHLSEDESSYVTSSLPQDPIPLNETAAYRSMISGSGSRQPPRQMSTEDDTDDDVEKQIASALVRNSAPQKAVEKQAPAAADDPSETSSQTFQTSHHGYVPSSVASRQTVNPTKGVPSKFQGVKITSDLDTDTEVDAGIFGSSRRPEDNSDFDFYD